MKQLNRLMSAAALAAIVAAFSACSKRSEVEADPAVQEAAADLAKISMTPEEAALASAKRFWSAFQGGDLASVHAWLPASYRNDISEVVKAYASKIDPELATLTASSVSALGTAIEKQADHIVEILQSGTLPIELDPEVIAQINADDIRTTGAFFAAASSWCNPEELARGDLSSFLSNAQIRDGIKSAVAQSAEIPQNMQFRVSETPSENPDSVVIECGNEEDGFETVEMVQVDGCWLPNEIVSDWNKWMDEAKSEAVGFEVPEEVAGQIRAMLPALQQSFATWGDAPSAAALQQQVLGTFMMLGALSM